MDTITYVQSLLTFYLKGEIGADQNFIKLKDPNTILGFIPLGSHQESIPINQITSVQSSFRMRLGKLVIGILVAILAIAALFNKGGFILFLIFGLIAANLILGAFDVSLLINMTSGRTRLLSFFIFDREKSAKAEQMINALISARLSDTNTREQTDRIVDAINRK
ncbi:MAG: hypothetical protein IKX47_05910 [Oscillospiraceae bacterium]|nr:hypothetical protein [Oscillospiraceae bacterium]